MTTDDRKNKNGCEAIRARLTLYALKDLDPVTQETIRVHLEGCEACRTMAHQVEETIGTLQEALAARPHHGTAATLTAERRRRIVIASKQPRLSLLSRIVRSPGMKIAASLMIGYLLISLMMPAVEPYSVPKGSVNPMVAMRKVVKHKAKYTAETPMAQVTMVEPEPMEELEQINETVADESTLSYSAARATQPARPEPAAAPSPPAWREGGSALRANAEALDKDTSWDELSVGNYRQSENAPSGGTIAHGTYAKAGKMGKGGGSTGGWQADQSVVAPPAQTASVQPADFDSVAMVKSPVILRGMFGNRTPGAASGEDVGDMPVDVALAADRREYERTEAPKLPLPVVGALFKKQEQPRESKHEAEGLGGEDGRRDSRQYKALSEERISARLRAGAATEVNGKIAAEPKPGARGEKALASKGFSGETTTFYADGSSSQWASGQPADVASGTVTERSLTKREVSEEASKSSLADVSDSAVVGYHRVDDMKSLEKVERERSDAPALFRYAAAESTTPAELNHESKPKPKAREMPEKKTLDGTEAVDGDFVAMSIGGEMGQPGRLVNKEVADFFSVPAADVSVETESLLGLDAGAAAMDVGGKDAFEMESLQDANGTLSASVTTVAGEAIDELKANIPEPDRRVEEDTEIPDPLGPRFKAVGVNPFVPVAENPFSTFSIDVDTASYTLARNYMLGGRLPPAEAVRTEEFVNFFDYAYEPPVGDTFRVVAETAPSRFGRGLQLMKIGVKGRRLGREEQRPAALTFLVDSSGSMNQPDRLGLVRSALELLLDGLAPTDLVAIIQFDNRARLILDHTPASERATILEAINAIQCGGGTNLEEGLRRAYEQAARHFVSRGENRILLMSDGVVNVGETSSESMLAKVETFRRQGLYLSVFGFGMGIYDDEMLKTLASKGKIGRAHV